MHCCANRCTGSASSATHCRTETGVAFAGEKRLFLARISAAVVMVVSCWPVPVAAEVPLVASSPRGCALCAKKFALRGLMVGVSAKKFALRAQNGPKLAIYGVLGEVFRGNAAGGPLLGELFRGRAAGRPLLGEVFRGTAAERSVLGEFCRTTTQVRPLLGGRHLRSNREPTCWDHHERMGMKKHSRRSAWQKCRTPTGGSHRGGPLRARRDSNPQPSEP